MAEGQILRRRSRVSVRPAYGLAYSGPTGRPRTQREFIE